MTKYLGKNPFSSRPASKQYMDNFDAIFGDPKQVAPAKGSVHEQVKQFHEAFGHPVRTTPTVPDLDTLKLRLKLVGEEFTELLEAAGCYNWEVRDLHSQIDRTIDSLETTERVDLVEVADALGDLDYVNEGFRLTCGINGEAVADEIHRSNMTKLGEDGKPVRRADGKTLKGPNFEEPNIGKALYG